MRVSLHVFTCLNGEASPNDVCLQPRFRLQPRRLHAYQPPAWVDPNAESPCEKPISVAMKKSDNVHVQPSVLERKRRSPAVYGIEGSATNRSVLTGSRLLWEFELGPVIRQAVRE